jgi:hypothetical protein
MKNRPMKKRSGVRISCTKQRQPRFAFANLNSVVAAVPAATFVKQATRLPLQDYYLLHDQNQQQLSTTDLRPFNHERTTLA